MPAEPTSARRLRVLFLCTGNSCRSQMAEGWAKALRARDIEAFSAGTHPQGLNPLAVQAMAEVGIDISTHASKRPEDVPVPIDLVVTVCDAARAQPGAQQSRANRARTEELMPGRSHTTTGGLA